jgi:hypothetical protein
LQSAFVSVARTHVHDLPELINCHPVLMRRRCPTKTPCSLGSAHKGGVGRKEMPETLPSRSMTGAAQFAGAPESVMPRSPTVLE